jgi:SpoVK/Ycf46/Vps4 family AAA+-type ATPase
VAIVVIQTHEEPRAMALLTRLGIGMASAVFRWTVTEGLGRVDIETPPQRFNRAPEEVLGHIRSSRQSGLYVLLDFHPWLDDPVNVRMLKDIALRHGETGQTLVLLSHELKLPPELGHFAAQFELRLPDENRLSDIVREQASRWAEGHPGRRVRTDETTFRELVRNLGGLTEDDARRLAHRVIFNDGAITEHDMPEVMQTKFRLLNREGVLSFEYDTASFSEVGGLSGLKGWLDQRRKPFLEAGEGAPLEPPKGVMLLGVQGGGKSLAARAVAGVWGVPLLRLDFGALYNKFHGETERNLRESLKSAQVMAPCVLWIDEIEKGIGGDAHDGGTSKRVLGTLLTWMAENRSRVFIVATANDISALPPELIRKGRMDEIFFVDLPDHVTRMEIFGIHLAKRDHEPTGFDLDRLASRSDGFSGSEIEQAVVSALYALDGGPLSERHLTEELKRTRPLSVVMAERIHRLRAWAAERTVSAG